MWPPITITITITGKIWSDYYYYYYYYSEFLRSLLLLLLLSRHKRFITITITISNSLTTLSEIADRIMNFIEKSESSLQWYHIWTNLCLTHSSSLLIFMYFIHVCLWFEKKSSNGTWDQCSQYLVMMASFTKWDTSLSETFCAGPMGAPLSEVLM